MERILHYSSGEETARDNKNPRASNRSILEVAELMRKEPSVRSFLLLNSLLFVATGAFGQVQFSATEIQQNKSSSMPGSLSQ